MSASSIGSSSSGNAMDVVQPEGPDYRRRFASATDALRSCHGAVNSDCISISLPTVQWVESTSVVYGSRRPEKNVEISDDIHRVLEQIHAVVKCALHSIKYPNDYPLTWQTNILVPHMQFLIGTSTGRHLVNGGYFNFYDLHDNSSASVILSGSPDHPCIARDISDILYPFAQATTLDRNAPKSLNLFDGDSIYKLGGTKPYAPHTEETLIAALNARPEAIVNRLIMRVMKALSQENPGPQKSKLYGIVIDMHSTGDICSRNGDKDNCRVVIKKAMMEPAYFITRVQQLTECYFRFPKGGLQWLFRMSHSKKSYHSSVRDGAPAGGFELKREGVDFKVVAREQVVLASSIPINRRYEMLQAWFKSSAEMTEFHKKWWEWLCKTALSGDKYFKEKIRALIEKTENREYLETWGQEFGGVATAQKLAKDYLQLRRTTKSKELKLTYLECAACLGSAKAQHQLSEYYCFKKEYELDLKWGQRSVDQDYLPAMSYLGFSYLFGLGTEENREVAEELFSKAIAKDMSQAFNIAETLIDNDEHEHALEFFQRIAVAYSKDPQSAKIALQKLIGYALQDEIPEELYSLVFQALKKIPGMPTSFRELVRVKKNKDHPHHAIVLATYQEHH